MQPPEYLYPLSGGLMLGSCVYHLLYFNGNVLGISGIYGSAISRAVSLVGLKLSRISTPGKKTTADTPANGNVHPHNDTAADDVCASDPLLANGSSSPKKKEIVLEDGNWQIAFTLGLLAAGVLLRAIRPYLERSLGAPIFDQSLGNESSKWLSLSTFVVGLLIGVGTRVRSSPKEVNKIDVQWMYSRPYALRYVTAITPFDSRNSNILCSCSSRTLPEPQPAFSTNPPRTIRCPDSPAVANPLPVLSLHHPTTDSGEMVSISFVIRDCGTFRIRTRACRDAPTIQNSKLPFPPVISKFRPVARVCCNRRTRTEYPCVDNPTSIFHQNRQPAVWYRVPCSEQP